MKANFSTFVHFKDNEVEAYANESLHGAVCVNFEDIHLFFTSADSAEMALMDALNSLHKMKGRG